MFRTNYVTLKANVITISNRFQHTFNSKQLVLKKYSNEINEALELNTREINGPNNGQLLVKMMAAPINPADLNIIQGKYGVLPKELPSPLGNEGVFEVSEVGSETSIFKKGDWVLPNKLGFGTWRSHVVESETNFIKIPNNLDKLACATLSVNPLTAYRMMQDFVKLSPGDTIIQNGANSGVGQAVIQLGKIMNLNIVNIVRKRENLEELKEYLNTLGAKYVYTEDMLRKAELTTDIWNQIPKPRLALNCVGGKATTDMIRLLDKDSTIVTYGGMSRMPVMLNTADFIFKDLKACGFWLTRWKSNNQEEFKNSIHNLCDLIAKGDFQAPRSQTFKLDEYEAAFTRNSTPLITFKAIFVN